MVSYWPLNARPRLRVSRAAFSAHGLFVAEDLFVLAHRFDSDMIAGLVHTGLATALRETVETGGQTIEVVRTTIMDIGRRAIER